MHNCFQKKETGAILFSGERNWCTSFLKEKEKLYVLICHGRLLHLNYELMNCGDSVRYRKARGGSMPPNVRRSLPARLYVVHALEQKSRV